MDYGEIDNLPLQLWRCLCPSGFRRPFVFLSPPSPSVNGYVCAASNDRMNARTPDHIHHSGYVPKFKSIVPPLCAPVIHAHNVCVLPTGIVASDQYERKNTKK